MIGRIISLYSKLKKDEKISGLTIKLYYSYATVLKISLNARWKQKHGLILEKYERETFDKLDDFDWLWLVELFNDKFEAQGKPYDKVEETVLELSLTPDKFLDDEFVKELYDRFVEYAPSVEEGHSQPSKAKREMVTAESQ